MFSAFVHTGSCHPPLGEMLTMPRLRASAIVHRSNTRAGAARQPFALLFTCSMSMASLMCTSCGAAIGASIEYSTYSITTPLVPPIAILYWFSRTAQEDVPPDPHDRRFTASFTRALITSLSTPPLLDILISVCVCFRIIIFIIL